MWVLKTKGETYYVNHVECNIPWSTKETPDNPHTKGSLKVKNCLLTIDEENTATISKLTEEDACRIRDRENGTIRIMCQQGSDMHNALKNDEFKHSPFKKVMGSCGSRHVVCDLLSKEEATFAALKYKFNVLMPNTDYYKQYDSKKEFITMEDDLDDE